MTFRRLPARIVSGLAVIVVAGLGSPREGRAQQAPVSAPSDSVALRPIGVSPRGAFLRALAVPGWGHAAIGSFSRGGFYFAFESATAYTFVRTRMRLSEARERAALRENIVRANLADEGITDPVEIENRLAEDELLQSYEDLTSSRERQQEDLVAFGIFLLLLTGADAYVSAHLSRFPTAIDVQGAVSDDGRAEVGLSVSVPW